VITWPDTYPARKAKTAPPTRYVEVLNETAGLLKEKSSKQLYNDDCSSTRNAYALQKVPATKAPVFDSYMKPEVSISRPLIEQRLPYQHC